MSDKINWRSEAHVGDAHRLHLFQEVDTWSVWLDTDIADRDGLCLAVELTKELALDNAHRVLGIATRSVKGL